MNVISGQNVDLIFPFPLSEVKRTYGWNHCYRTLTETDDTPSTQEDFITWMESVVQTIPTWGIIDKNHITNIKHEAPLIGIGVFEPIVCLPKGVIRNGLFHVATARKAWRTGLVDEAGLLVIRALFEEIPTLLRVSASIMEKNFPAKALAKRMGFKFEGLTEDAIVKGGIAENLVNFGLTRKRWEACQWEQRVVAEPRESEVSSWVPLEGHLEASSQVSLEEGARQIPQIALEVPTCLDPQVAIPAKTPEVKQIKMSPEQM